MKDKLIPITNPHPTLEEEEKKGEGQGETKIVKQIRVGVFWAIIP